MQYTQQGASSGSNFNNSGEHSYNHGGSYRNNQYNNNNSQFRGGGNKKGQKSLNYLLNFSVAPPPSNSQYDEVSRLLARRRKKNFEPYSKEQFVIANYRFMVRAGQDYTENIYDSDKLVDWSSIEQVIYSIPVKIPMDAAKENSKKLSENDLKNYLPLDDASSNCPICLEPFVAAKITKCGHIFCWSCVLQYLQLGDKGWRRCPMCFESIYPKSLKSVTFQHVQNYQEDQFIEFDLLIRPKGNIVSFRKERRQHHTNLNTLLSYTDSDAKYNRFTQVRDIGEILTRELLELEDSQHQHISSQDLANLPAIEEALNLLQERKSEWEIYTKLTNLDKKTTESTHKLQEYDFSSRSSDNKEHDPVFSESEEEIESGPSSHRSQHSHSSGEHTNRSNNNEDDELKDFYSFYQACDGQFLFMHPVNMKMLLEEYGSAKNLPLKIHAKIVEIENNQQNEERRKIFRFLHHLPMASNFSFIEVDLRNHVSEQTFNKFKRDIQARRSKRVQKQKQADWETKRQQQEDELRILEAKTRNSMVIQSDDLEVFPYMSEAQQLEMLTSNNPPLPSNVHIESAPINSNNTRRASNNSNSNAQSSSYGTSPNGNWGVSQIRKKEPTFEDLYPALGSSTTKKDKKPATAPVQSNTTPNNPWHRNSESTPVVADSTKSSNKNKNNNNNNDSIKNKPTGSNNNNKQNNQPQKSKKAKFTVLMTNTTTRNTH